MRKLILILFLASSNFSNAQTDSIIQQGCSIRISLLTCTPGQELYSTFGHSAFRVADSSNHSDIVYNYGTFDFDDPLFYQKFIKGKLLYFVSVDSLPAFLREYQYYKRGVTEQVLNLSCEEKTKLVAALFDNAKEENKYYRYDFNYDNCTTRLRDMLEKAAGKEMETKNILPEPGTAFRKLIHFYLNRGGQQWSKLGIDILLGSPLDKNVTNREAMFLPDYLMMAFDSSELNGQPVVFEKKIILDEFAAYKTKSAVTPLLVFSILFLIISTLSFLHRDSWNLFFKIFDFIFFFMLGSLGVLLLFMWLGTDHAMCKDNYNLLWALPFHLPISFMLFSSKSWVNVYFRFIFFYSIALLVSWFFLPQQCNTALIPVVGIIIARSFYLGKRVATEAQKH